MDDALYFSLCQTMRAICLDIHARQNPTAPLLVEWQKWARVFRAGLIHSKSAVRAALAAHREAALAELDGRETGPLSHAAADLAWAAVHAAAGENDKAETLAEAARERLATHPDTAAVDQTRDPHGRGASERKADPAAHTRLLAEQSDPTDDRVP